MVAASTVPCGLISTTTTFAIGLPLASFTRPVIITVARGGLSIFSTGEVSSVGVEAGAGVGSGVEVGKISGVGAVTGGASGVGLAMGSGVASGDEVGDVAGGAVDDGVSGDGVVCGVVTGASGEGVENGVEDGDTAGPSAVRSLGVVTGAGVAVGVFSGDEADAAGALIVLLFALSGTGDMALAAGPAAGPIRSSSPSSEPLTLR